LVHWELPLHQAVLPVFQVVVLVPEPQQFALVPEPQQFSVHQALVFQLACNLL
jgi:hypothetical protein